MLRMSAAPRRRLLNHILKSPDHGMKFAIIENEFGEIGVDDGVLKVAAEDSIVRWAGMRGTVRRRECDNFGAKSEQKSGFLQDPLAHFLPQKSDKIAVFNKIKIAPKCAKLRQNAPNCANNLNAFSAQQNVISK